MPVQLLPPDLEAECLRLEQGTLTEREVLTLFSALIAANLAWRRLGVTGPIASALIGEGYLTNSGEWTPLAHAAVQAQENPPRYRRPRDYSE